jgi:hypothetical protein
VPITTLADVRAKLGLAEDDTSQDLNLQGILAGVERQVLNISGYSLVPIVGRQDTIRNVREGIPFFTTLRPITAVTAVDGRLWGSPTWSPLSAEVLDGNKGEFVIIGAYTGAVASFPPVEAPMSPWFRRRVERVWPLVRVTYDVARHVPSADLKEAVALIAAAASANAAGALQSVSVGAISESYAVEATQGAGLPSWAAALLAPHLRTTVQMVT